MSVDTLGSLADFSITFDNLSISDFKTSFSDALLLKRTFE